MAKRKRPAGLPARIRAAVAYSTQEQPDIAKAIGVSAPLLSRWGSGTATPSDPDLARLSNACGVPMWFLENGYKEPDLEHGVDRRLRQLDLRVAELATQVGQLVDDQTAVQATMRALGNLDEVMARLGRDIGRGQPLSRGARRSKREAR